ncbi:MAG: ParA family protein [Methylococcales bacterium]|nr:ParA family protein [Methylococcales bacterium]MDP3840222.1 ParA family protein [Methylococcales bacterium]
MAIKIVLFNHKGGVSKTTTSYNLGWMLASLGKKVLLVDADPQCNLSSLILGEYFEEYYFNDATKLHNIKDGVKVAFQGKPKPIEAVTCFSPSANENLFLLAGHADLSEYDAALSFAQNSNNAITALENLPGAFNELISKTSEEYNIDFVLIDLNPGLSAINQNLFISSDAFIIPTNPDPFSIMALNTLSIVLPRWVEWADRMRPLFEEATYPLSNSRPKFIGEIIQRFNIRKGKAAKPYRDNIDEIKTVVREKFAPEIKKHNMLFSQDIYNEVGIADDFCLLQLKDFQGLLPKANNAGVPVFALTSEQLSETGTVLEGLEKNRDLFANDFRELSNKIIKLECYAKSI